MSTSIPLNPFRIGGSGATVCRILGIILLIFALPELLLSGFFAWRSYEREQSWISVEALVYEVEKKDAHSDTTDYYYYPHFRFTAQDDREYSVSSTMGSNPARYKVGDRIAVIYPAEKPAEAEINSFANLYIFPLIFGIFGAMLSFSGMVLLLVARQLRRRQTPPELPAQLP